ncbi:CRISPR-associated CXXC_CXXC protein Cst1 [Methanocaldococcus infernus ME]|uniref:CRISPR-associated CXXC_CXXC protein Cst1 n=1 Tax=Methanocaldococcus infernus (strain DSM 11812 / JCM 15783 / ME) TaxID=573063 RepID=D5VSN1_METIM|nr:type I-B CRISPR-associated protein Cas8b1/Cst1 [Methanocaldococcus infernus]ADG13584.1 CRISPR-associated CXXC_CXXC protein Cst1 [Methanocaldococcus infernus ME]
MGNKTFYWTGHPFADAGLSAILLLNNKQNPDEIDENDIKKAIEFASNLYAKNEWVRYLSGKIFPNNGFIMTNPSMSKKRSPENIAKNLWKLYENIPEILEPSSKERRCIICGRRVPYGKGDRSIFPLLGTGKMLNFFHSGNPKGEDICAHCIFLAQFMPLVAYNLSSVLVIHTYPYSKMLRFYDESLRQVRISSLVPDAKGFRKPENFFFKLLIDITKNVESSKYWKNTVVTLYYFINDNRSQNIDIIYIPNDILRFVAFAGEVDPEGWRNIVNMGWSKKDNLNFEEMEKTRVNEVYKKLLNDESILRYFYDGINKKVNASWELLEFYCLEVLKLDKEALDFIKDVGDRIIETIEKLNDNDLRKIVGELERSTKLYEFENFFIRVEKIRQKNGIPRSLLTFDEFARLLMGYGEDITMSWKVVKDLLLFRIYEKLHDRLIKTSEENYEGDEK